VSHRHLDSRKLWTSTITDPDLKSFAKAADLVALAARVLALEAPVVVPPPVVPPPVPKNITTTAGDGVVDLSWKP
jgi:hypothetical protein